MHSQSWNILNIEINFRHPLVYIDYGTLHVYKYVIFFLCNITLRVNFWNILIILLGIFHDCKVAFVGPIVINANFVNNVGQHCSENYFLKF